LCCSVADDARVGRQFGHLYFGERSDGQWLELAEGVAGARPLLVDDAPAHAGLEDGLAHHLEVVAEASRLDLFRRTF
jgi:hypothetical protein